MTYKYSAGMPSAKKIRAQNKNTIKKKGPTFCQLGERAMLRTQTKRRLMLVLIQKEAMPLPLTKRRQRHVVIMPLTLTKRRQPPVLIPKEAMGLPQKATSRAYSKRSYGIAPDIKKASSRAYSKIRYGNHKESVCASRRARYILAEPKPDVKELYLKHMQVNMLGDSETRFELTTAFKKRHATQMPRVLGRTVCRLAAKRLLNKTLQVRKEHAGSLLKSTRQIKTIQVQREDFGPGCHTVSSEPYFYDSAYQPVKTDSAVPIKKDGKCVIANEIKADRKSSKTGKWESTSECKRLTTAEVDAILTFTETFEKPMPDVRHVLGSCDDGCPNQHYTKDVASDVA